MEKPRNRKKLFWWSLLSVLIAAAALTMIYYEEVLSAKVELLVVESLRGSLGSDIRVDGVDLDLFPVSITIQGLKFPAVEEGTDVTPLSIDRVELSLSPRSLLTEILVIKRMRLEGVNIVVSRQRDGKFAWVTLPAVSPDAPRAGPHQFVLVRRILLEKASITLVDPFQDWSLRFPRLEASVTPDLRMKRFDIEFEGAEGTWTRSGLTESALTAQGTLSLHEDEVRISALQVSLDGSTARLAGTIRNIRSPDPSLDLVAEAKLHGTPIRILYPAWAGLSSTITIQGKVGGRIRDPQADGRARIDALSLGQTQLFKGKLNFSYKDAKLSLEAWQVHWTLL